MTYKKTYNPCDECNYSYSKNNEESNMCKICEFKELVERDYSKDYFTGMRHLADAIIYEIERCKEYWVDKADIENKKKFIACFYVWFGLDEAKKIVEKTLTMQLEVKGDGDEVQIRI